MHVRVDGAVAGPTVVFANATGTDLRTWDGSLPLACRRVRSDKRGHGPSERGGEASVGDLAEDVAALIEAKAREPVAMVGLSLGGLVARALGARGAGLVRALVLSNAAARIGTAASWQARIDAVRAGWTPSLKRSCIAGSRPRSARRRRWPPGAPCSGGPTRRGTSPAAGRWPTTPPRQPPSACPSSPSPGPRTRPRPPTSWPPPPRRSPAPALR